MTTNDHQQPAHKGVVQSIEAKAVTVRIDTDVIIFPKRLFSPTINVGDDVYISVMATEHYKKHHESFAKEIVNTIFGKKT